MFLMIYTHQPSITHIGTLASFALQQGRLIQTPLDPRVPDGDVQNTQPAFRLQAAPRGTRRGAYATWTGTGPSIAEATRMIRRILHDRESAGHNNAPVNNSTPGYRELVVGELVTSHGDRLLSITVHPHRPILPFFVIILVTNIHPSRSFSAFNCPSRRYPEDILVDFTRLLRTHRVQLVSLVRTFSAVISAEKDWDEMGMLSCFQ